MRERGPARVRLLRDRRPSEAGPTGPPAGGDPGLTGPERSCAVCRTRRPKEELIRIVRSPSGRIGVDGSGRAPGRGAYVCRRTGCVRAIGRKGVVARALRSTLRPEDLATLRGDLEREMA
ncbi:MAG TPA: YlxR family protein [Actinomycetota bacterium]|nr:YlxR family protein [Actinomycetota bacterium]